jgi:hypothetical protein
MDVLVHGTPTGDDSSQYPHMKLLVKVVVFQKTYRHTHIKNEEKNKKEQTLTLSQKRVSSKI